MTEPAPLATAPDAADLVVLPAALRRPRPTDGPGVASLIRDLLVHWGLERQVAERISVDAEVVGPDVSRLTVAATRVTLPSSAEPTSEPLPDEDLDEVPGVLGEFHLLADAVRWEKVELHGEFHQQRVGFTWLMRGDEVVGLRFDDSQPAGGRGTVRVETDLEPLVESIRLLAARELRPHGVLVRKLKARATQFGERSYRVEAEAAIRWKVLPLSARLSLIAVIDDDLVLRLTDVQVSSVNPLAGIALAFARRPLREGLSEPIPLREAFGPELVDFTLRVEPRLLFEASFAELR